jgi:hypothetical protein
LLLEFWQRSHFDSTPRRTEGSSFSASTVFVSSPTVPFAFNPTLLLPPTELGILQTLETEGRVMYAGEIAAELDKSYQLVGRRGKTLAERGLVNRDVNDQGRRTFEITPLAESSYFQLAVGDALHVGDGRRGPRPRCAAKCRKVIPARRLFRIWLSVPLIVNVRGSTRMKR